NAHFRVLSEINRGVYEILIAFICPFIIAANCVAMLIMTRKELRSTYNFVFFLIAIDQTVVMTTMCLSFLRAVLFSYCSPGFLSLSWALFDLIVLANLMPLCKAHATWLAGIYLYFNAFMIKDVRGLQLGKNTVLMLLCVSTLFVIVTNIPTILSYTVQWVPYQDVCNSTVYGDLMVPFARESDVLYENDCLMLMLGSILTGSIHSAIACVLLFAFTIGLLLFLREVRKKRKMMVLHTTSRESPDRNRTTTLFILIMVTTVISEFPLALLGMLEGFISFQLRFLVTHKLSLLFTSLMIITSSVNLFVYLFMSKNFREVRIF
ncbi:hypothetical protein PMAYCL1PPCAC_21679, partial [Pristionchus mayeri]